MTASKLGQRDLAQQQLEKALRLNRQQPRALLEMAELSFEDRHYVPARDYYDRFSLLTEQNARSLLLGVRLENVFEDRDTAAFFGLKLTRLYPGTPEYQQYLSEQ
jgi:type IV pilus assembly protein PilF